MAVICYLSGSNIVPFSDALSDETYIEHNQDGNDVLVFFVDTKNPVYRQIHEETVVQFGDNNFVVKKIQDDKFEAFVDLDFLKATYHAGKYSTGTKTLEQQLRSMLDNTWTIDFTDGSTYGNAVIEIEDGTNYDIMQACMNAYGCYFVWKTLLKTVLVYSHTNQSSSGKYLTKELNLESVDFQGDTTELVTRLYPRGKDDTTIVGATVTNDQIQQYGLIQGTHYNSSLKYIADYVECHDYTDKVLCGSLSDDRFTDSTNLLAYALKQVAKSAMPVRSYECSVINLAKQNPEYAFLTIQLHATITLIDNERGINVDHRVVKYIEYPDNRARDKVTLSTVPDDITNTIEKVASSVRIDTDKIVSDMDAAIQHATDLITSATGGYLMLKDTDNDGKPDELVISDKSDPTDSTAKVWRFNKNGLAHSSNGYGGTYSDAAITMDGHVVADRIAAHSITSDMISTNGLSAGVITSGVLTSADGSAKFDLTNNYLIAKRTVGNHELAAKLTTGAYRLLFDTHEIGALGTISGTKVSPWLYYNDQYADELNIGSGSDGVTHPNIIVNYSQIDFMTSDVRRGYIDADGYHGTVRGTLFGNVWAPDNASKIGFVVGGHEIMNIQSDGIHGTLCEFETWKSGTYATDKSTLQTAINGKAASTHDHSSDSWFTTALSGKAESSHTHAMLGDQTGASIWVGDKNIVSCYKDGNAYKIDIADEATLTGYAKTGHNHDGVYLKITDWNTEAQTIATNFQTLQTQINGKAGISSAGAITCKKIVQGNASVVLEQDKISLKTAGTYDWPVAYNVYFEHGQIYGLTQVNVGSQGVHIGTHASIQEMSDTLSIYAKINRNGTTMSERRIKMSTDYIEFCLNGSTVAYIDSSGIHNGAPSS